MKKFNHAFFTLKSLFSKAAGNTTVPEAHKTHAAPPPPAAEQIDDPARRTFSREYDHFKFPSVPVTPETLKETPRHFNNPDGKALIWAYIGSDDATRGDSRGANGLAHEVTRLMGGRMVYVDQAMLDKNFKFTSGLQESITSLITQDGSPDIVIGASGRELALFRSFKPTMMIDKINECIDEESRSRTNLVPHDLTPDILAAAGREFRQKHPDLKGKLYTVMLSTFYNNEEHKAMRQLAHILACEDDSTVYFCPNRRVHPAGYHQLAQTFYSELLSLGIADRVRVFTPEFEELRTGYNPYRGLIAESDHILQIGDSHSMVAESLCTGRPLYMTQQFRFYPELIKKGYIKDFFNAGHYPLPTDRLDPISVTTEIAGKIVDEFDRLARLRTIGEREDADRRQRRLERVAALDARGIKIA